MPVPHSFLVAPSFRFIPALACALFFNPLSGTFLDFENFSKNSVDQFVTETIEDDLSLFDDNSDLLAFGLFTLAGWAILVAESDDIGNDIMPDEYKKLKFNVYKCVNVTADCRITRQGTDDHTLRNMTLHLDAIGIATSGIRIYGDFLLKGFATCKTPISVDQHFNADWTAIGTSEEDCNLRSYAKVTNGG